MTARPPIVCIVGRSGAGKTTLIEKLLPALARRGLKVATVKHDVHGFEMDREGKDTWRHRRAGAVAVVISSARQIAMIRDADRDHDLAEIRDMLLGHADIVIAEGYKRSSHPKIEVHRKALGPELLCGPDDDVVAFATDEALAVPVPQVPLDDAEALAELLVARVRRLAQTT